MILWLGFHRPSFHQSSRRRLSMALRHAQKGSGICSSAFTETTWSHSARMRLSGRKNALLNGYAEILAFATSLNGPGEAAFTLLHLAVSDVFLDYAADFCLWLSSCLVTTYVPEQLNLMLFRILIIPSHSPMSSNNEDMCCPSRRTRSFEKEY